MATTITFNHEAVTLHEAIKPLPEDEDVAKTMLSMSDWLGDKPSKAVERFVTAGFTPAQSVALYQLARAGAECIQGIALSKAPDILGG